MKPRTSACRHRRRRRHRGGRVAALVLNAFQSNLVFFYTPTQVAANGRHRRTFRLGGMVAEGSVKRDGVVQLRRHRHRQDRPCRSATTGILPDLFKEGKGVVAQGQLETGVLRRPRGAGQARRELHAAGPPRRQEGQQSQRRKHRQGRRREPMIPESATCSWLALGVALLQGTLPLVGAQPARRLDGAGAAAGAAMALFIVAAFGGAGQLRSSATTSVLYVAQQLQQRAAAAYRVAGVWGGHEGSLLLWVRCCVWIRSRWRASRATCREVIARILAVMGLVSGRASCCSCCSRPTRSSACSRRRAGRRDLNPLLQDPAW